MKIRILAVAVTLFLSALAAMAEHTPAVLTTEGVVYTVGALPATQLELIRREGDQRQTLLVPSTDDASIETAAQLAYDAATSTLYVVWHNGDSVNVIRRFGDGTWSHPLLIDVGGQRLGLEVVLTRSKSFSLLHAAWWKAGAEPVAEYALMAFEHGEPVSTYVSTLDALAAETLTSYPDEPEAMTEHLHPPLAMTRSGAAGVEIVYGSHASTQLTRLVLDPRISPNVRIWKPSRETGGRTPRAGLMSATGDPVQALLSDGRIILYTPDTAFRFVMYDGGKWSPERMIHLDEGLTREQIIQELRETIKELESGSGEEEPDEDIIE